MTYKTRQNETSCNLGVFWVKDSSRFVLTCPQRLYQLLC